METIFRDSTQNNILTALKNTSGNADFMVITLAHLQGYEVKKSKSPEDSKANSPEVYCHDPVNSMPFTMLLRNSTDLTSSFKITVNTSDSEDAPPPQTSRQNFSVRKNAFIDVTVQDLQDIYKTLTTTAKHATKVAKKKEHDYIANGADVYDVPRNNLSISRLEVTMLEVEEARETMDLAWKWVLEFEEHIFKMRGVVVELDEGEREVVIVNFIDDLDRCTNGKSVAILEAVHILFHETRPEDSAYFGRRFLIHSISGLWWRRMCYWFNWFCCIAVPSWLCCCWTSNAPTWSQPPQPMQGQSSAYKSPKTVVEQVFKGFESQGFESLGLNPAKTHRSDKQAAFANRRYLKKMREGAVVDNPAPVITQFMIDPRLTKQEVELYFGNTLAKTRINGLKWLEKVVQVPICLQILRPEQIKGFLEGKIPYEKPPPTEFEEHTTEEDNKEKDDDSDYSYNTENRNKNGLSKPG